MHTPDLFPGTAQHQALLRQIVAYYSDDPRILALIIFGSVPRGTWDQHSDLDLDVVVRDDLQIDVLAEVRDLCASFAPLGEQPLIIAPSGPEAADVVLESLGELSIRYHPLATTSPNIVESAQLLWGVIPIEAIKAAGSANARPDSYASADPWNGFARQALAVDRELHRRRLWHALPLLDLMRAIVVETFAGHHGGGRPYSVFQAQAPESLRQQLGATLPQSNLASAQAALLRLLDLVAQPQAELGLPRGLSSAQQTIVERIRSRQQRLHLDQIED